MANEELSEIATSMQAAIHRAYALGRGDALRKVMAMVQEDGLSSKAMVLLGPADQPAAEPSPEPTPAMAEAAAPILSEGPPPATHAASPTARDENEPWWRRKSA